VIGKQPGQRVIAPKVWIGLQRLAEQPHEARVDATGQSRCHIEAEPLMRQLISRTENCFSATNTPRCLSIASKVIA
jgi:hypothetical protein